MNSPVHGCCNELAVGNSLSCRVRLKPEQDVAAEYPPGEAKLRDLDAPAAERPARVSEARVVEAPEAAPPCPCSLAGGGAARERQRR